MKFKTQIGLLFCILFIFSCTKDRKFPKLATDEALSADYKLIHYWNFNDPSTTQTLTNPTYSASSASLEYKGAKLDAVAEGGTINARNNDVAGGALRLRNPAGDFILTLPTVGFKDVVLRFATTRTSTGPQIQHVYYSLDGTSFVQNDLLDADYAASETFILHSLNFKNILGANNNPKFKVKVVFETNTTGDTGNVRYDNITLDGIPTGNLPIIKSEEVFQYWNFNNKTDLTTPNLGNGSLVYGGASVDDVAGTALNAQNNDAASTALRLRNPSGDFVLATPSKGFEKLVLKFAVQRSSSGAAIMNIFYTTDGVTFVQDGLTSKTFFLPAENLTDANLGYEVVTIDLKNIAAVNNNNLLKLKITSAPTASGNSRFDNITMSGSKL